MTYLDTFATRVKLHGLKKEDLSQKKKVPLALKLLMALLRLVEFTSGLIKQTIERKYGN